MKSSDERASTIIQTACSGRHEVIIGLAVLSMLVLASASEEVSAQTAPPSPLSIELPATPLASPAMITQPLAEARGSYSFGLDRRTAWTEDAERLQSLLQGAAVAQEPGRALLQAFRKGEHVAVAAWLGERPTGGFWIDFVSAVSDGSAITVTLREERPSRDTFVTQALTTPAAVFLLPWRGERSLSVIWDDPRPR